MGLWEALTLVDTEALRWGLLMFPQCHRLKEASGWQLAFSSPRLDWPVERLALTARVLGGALGEHDKMVAAATGGEILLWALQAQGGGSEIGMPFGLF